MPDEDARPSAAPSAPGRLAGTRRVGQRGCCQGDEGGWGSYAARSAARGKDARLTRPTRTAPVERHDVGWPSRQPDQLDDRAGQRVGQRRAHRAPPAAPAGRPGRPAAAASSGTRRRCPAGSARAGRPPRRRAATPSSRAGVLASARCSASTVSCSLGALGAAAPARAAGPASAPLGLVAPPRSSATGRVSRPSRSRSRDVLAGQVPRGGRQVVGGHRGQAQLPASAAAAAGAPVAVPLEPQDRGAEHAAVAQVVAHPRLDRAEVLADHEGAGPVRLQGQDPDHRLVVVAHVGARRPAARPAGTHQSRNSPMTWSTRSPPACRSTVRSMSRYGQVARPRPAGPAATAAATSPGPAG